MHASIYASEKGKLTLVAYLIIIVFILAILVLSHQIIISHPTIGAVLILPVVFFSWLWFGTDYKIEKDYLYYTNGPFKGKIEIKTIREIIKNKTVWVGYKPALAQKGLIIKFNKWDEIYISPKDKDMFIRDLLAKNQAIS